VIPEWTVEPSLDAIRTVARRHLPRAVDSVSFLANGAFNRLYTLHHGEATSNYLMRVTLPVKPFYKTASEVATLEYVLRYTSIPVPRVLAYSAEAQADDNIIGFEWILMERMPGVVLGDNLMLASMPLHTKFLLAEKVGSLAKELERRRFNAIGSLYFTTELQTRLCRDGRQERAAILPVDHDSDFCIGPIVDPAYYQSHRLTIPASSNTGPFTTEMEWIQSRLDIEEQALTIPNPANPVLDDEEDDETPEQLDTLRSLRELAPAIFPTPQSSFFTLQHDDISAKNLLIDPETYSLTAWVDWENITIGPPWNARHEPVFLEATDYEREGYNWPIPINLQPEESEDEDALEIKEAVLKLQLRGKFHQGSGTRKEYEEEGVEKRKFERFLRGLEIYHIGAMNWVKGFKGC
jgi:hypothetical protein